jgi:hypothetical protein
MYRYIDVLPLACPARDDPAIQLKNISLKKNTLKKEKIQARLSDIF